MNYTWKNEMINPAFMQKKYELRLMAIIFYWQCWLGYWGMTLSYSTMQYNLAQLSWRAFWQHILLSLKCVHNLTEQLQFQKSSVAYSCPKCDCQRRPTVLGCLNRSPCIQQMEYHTSPKNIVGEYLNPWDIE